MSNWVKWWKDKTLIKIIITMIFTVIVAFLFAYFIPQGWVIAIIVTLLVRTFYIKPLFQKKYNEIVDNL